MLFSVFLSILTGCSQEDVTKSDEIISFELDDGCNPLSLTDDCFLPFPSLHYTEEDANRNTGLHLSYETSDLKVPEGELNFSLNMFNIADGVSPLSPALINFGVDVDPSFLSGWGAQVGAKNLKN